MIILKTSVLLVGMLFPSSASLGTTVVPSMVECRAFLAQEEDRYRKVDAKPKIETKENTLEVELSKIGMTYYQSYECVEVK